MKKIAPAPQTSLYLAASATACFGLLTSSYIYRTATDLPRDELLDQLEDSRQYLRALEMYGGKANIMAAEFSRWFDSLWHGRHLAITVGILAILISFVLCLAASYLCGAAAQTPGKGRVPVGATPATAREKRQKAWEEHCKSRR